MQLNLIAGRFDRRIEPGWQGLHGPRGEAAAASFVSGELLFIEQNHLCTGRCNRPGCRRTGRPCSYDDQVCMFHIPMIPADRPIIDTIRLNKKNPRTTMGRGFCVDLMER
jgi:hypothetical protein